MNLIDSIDIKQLPVFVTYYDKHNCPTDKANTILCACYYDEKFDYFNDHQTLCRIVEEPELTQFLKEYT